MIAVNYKLSEECCDEQHSERHEGKGKIAFEPRFFLYKKLFGIILIQRGYEILLTKEEK